jgi:hypothetical protein
MSTDVSEVRAASIIRAITIALTMKAARTSETLIDIQLRTRRYIPEDSELHTRRRENLKSHNSAVLLYGCETLSLTLREEHRLRVFENRVLRGIFGPKRDEVTG